MNIVKSSLSEKIINTPTSSITFKIQGNNDDFFKPADIG